MKSFINNQIRIIDEIIIKDSNYKQACLSFVEKTLKYITNDDLDSIDLINKYIQSEKLKHDLHRLRKEANDIKHEYEESDFSESQAIISLTTLDEYLTHINKIYPNIIDTVNFKKLFDERKNNWLKEHGVEVEKIVTIEKEVPIIKKEYITIEKPVVKEITKQVESESYNKDYMEIQLLNETNKMGLFINSLNVKAFEISLEILLKKLEHIIPLTLDENSIFLENLEEFYPFIIDYLPKYKLSSVFNYNAIIELLYLESQKNKIDLLLKFISDEKQINLEQEKMINVMKNYILNNKKQALPFILKHKNKFIPIKYMRNIFSSTLEFYEIVPIIGDFETKNWLNLAFFDKITKNYDCEINNEHIELLKLYPWGQKIICLEYIINDSKLITYSVFEECYKKIKTDEINILILVSQSENILNIIKKLEKSNIYLVNDFYKICLEFPRKLIDEILPSYKSLVNFNCLSYKSVNPLVINHYIDTNQINNNDLLRKLFIESLQNLNLERINNLLKQINIEFTENEIEFFNLEKEVSSNDEIAIIKKVIDKFNGIPIILLKSCMHYNFDLCCELFGSYILDNMYIFDKGYYSYSTGNRKNYIIDYNDTIKILTKLTSIMNKHQLEKALYYSIKLYKINDTYEKYDEAFIAFLKLINKKGIFIHNIISKYSDFFKKIDRYDLTNIFENNLELINNLSLTNTIKIFTESFIVDNIFDEKIELYLNNKCCSNSEIVKKVLDKNDLDIIKKALALGIDFNTNLQTYNARIFSPLTYYKWTVNYNEDKNEIIQFLQILELKSILISDPNQLLKKDSYNRDYVDILLENPNDNKETLEFIQNNFELNKFYSNIFEENSNDITTLRKKLYINNKYFNNVKKYDEILQFDADDINSLNLDSEILIKIYNYYNNYNDTKKIKLLKTLNNKELKEYIKQQNIIAKEEEILEHEKLEKEQKRIEEKKEKEIKIIKEKKEKEQKKKELKYNRLFGILFHLIPINAMYIMFAWLFYLIFEWILPTTYEAPWFSDNIFLIIIIDVFLVIIVHIIHIYKNRNDEYFEWFDFSAWNLIPLIGLFMLFIILSSIANNNFINNFNIVNTTYTENCTIITVKNTNNSASINFDDISYGYHDLYLGSHNTIIYNSTTGNSYNDNKYTAEKNSKEIKEYCGINFEIDNLVVYSASYVSGTCGSGNNKYSCGRYEISSKQYFEKNVEYNLVFETTTNNNLYFDGHIIE